MSCSNIPYSWEPSFGCGGNIKRIEIYDGMGNCVEVKTYRKWEHHSLDTLKNLEIQYARIEDYETAVEIRDEITLKGLGI
jgi:hypothetical protein